MAEVRKLVAGVHPEPGDELWVALSSDPRKGISDIRDRILRGVTRAGTETARLAALRLDEVALWESGATHVAGVDEAGRGPLAGPVVAAAVILPAKIELHGLDDSKKLSPAKREQLFPRIMHEAIAVGIGSASEKVIDDVNILRATLGAMRDAVTALSVRPDHVIVDGTNLPDLDIPLTAIPRGDERSAAIAAASVIAKVTRDRLLTELDSRYPGYGFAKHKGYGTGEHVAALARLGPCEIHRRSFGLVMDAAGGYSEAYMRFRSKLMGAETHAALERIGKEIAREKESIPSYELTKLRGIYTRAHTRLRAGLSPAR